MTYDLPPSIATAASLPNQAIVDIVDGARLYDLWGWLALHDVRQRFRRSVLGPFWLTISMGIMIAAMGFVFSAVFQQNVSQTLPYIATGIIFWTLLTSCLNEGATVFVVAEATIRNVPMPITVHFFRMIFRNVIIWLFNMAIYVLIVLAFGISLNWSVALFFPGLILFLINVSWMSFVVAILSTRYRDIPQVIFNFIQVIFFVTPVFWSPLALPQRMPFIELNPFYHLLALVRAPLLGGAPVPESWLFCAGLTILGIPLSLWLYRRAHSRIAYWV